ncbi:MAG: hypothetical protein LBL05_00190 [Synergistaceae bacterium]|nr:hypothetical protein [Synergistaceae bacterium]
MSDLPESQKSWKDLEIEKETRSALESFFIYVLFITLLRLLGHGEIAGGIIDDRVFGNVTFNGIQPITNTFLLYHFILRLRFVPLLYVAAPIAILVYAVITKANENSRRLAVCFLTFALINYLIPPIITLFTNPIVDFIASHTGRAALPLFNAFMNVNLIRFIGNWSVLAYLVCVTIFMSAYVFKLRSAFINLRALKTRAGTDEHASLPWFAVIPVTAAIFILPLLVR